MYYHYYFLIYNFKIVLKFNQIGMLSLIFYFPRSLNRPKGAYISMFLYIFRKEDVRATEKDKVFFSILSHILTSSITI